MAVVAEWLWRWTRNPLGSPRAGSNPADCVNFCFSFIFLLSTLDYVLINLFLIKNYIVVIFIIRLTIKVKLFLHTE